MKPTIEIGRMYWVELPDSSRLHVKVISTGDSPRTWLCESLFSAVQLEIPASATWLPDSPEDTEPE